MKFLAIVAFVFTTFTMQLSANAASGGYYGFNVGAGFPFVTQGGFTYATGGSFSMDINYNSFSISDGQAELSLTKPEVNVKWHPFSGSFFLGLGIGQQTLSTEATDLGSGLSITVDVSSMMITPSLGWMWGVSNGGFFMGLDFGMTMPQGAELDIDDSSGIASSTQAYQDAEDLAEQFGKTSFPVFTFLRLGYLF